MIQTQRVNGRTADACYPDQPFTIPAEVVLAKISTGVEQADDPAGIQVHPGKVRALEVVAMKTSEGKIIGASRTRHVIVR